MTLASGSRLSLYIATCGLSLYKFPPRPYLRWSSNSPLSLHFFNIPMIFDPKIAPSVVIHLGGKAIVWNVMRRDNNGISSRWIHFVVFLWIIFQSLQRPKVHTHWDILPWPLNYTLYIWKTLYYQIKGKNDRNHFILRENQPMKSLINQSPKINIWNINIIYVPRMSFKGENLEFIILKLVQYPIRISK